MTETMLVRAAGGAWEQLVARDTLPPGGVAEHFGLELGPVLGHDGGVVVAACEPDLGGTAPDALCVDASGGIWIVQLDLAGGGERLLPSLLSIGGALTGMPVDTFEQLCDQPGKDGLAAHVRTLDPASGDLDDATLSSRLAETLATGRFRLVSIVGHASSGLVQSMRFLNASGANASVFEASAWSSASVTAIRATAVDVGRGGAAASPAPPAGAAVTAPPAPAAAPSAAATVEVPAAASGAAAFARTVADSGNTSHPELVERFVTALEEAFDAVEYEDAGAESRVRGIVGSPDGSAADVVVVSADATVVISFEALAELDPTWDAREELCQGMERLLGTDLGDVRKISQLNLTVDEHLMDDTLTDALAELLADTVSALRGGARQAA